MRTLAICARAFKGSVRRAAGVEPLTSPPLALGMLAPADLAGADAKHPYRFLYVKLHGVPGRPYWYGDGYVKALDADTVRAADLGGCVVFASTCYLGDEDSPMMSALLEAGAVVVAGAGLNYAAPVQVVGSDVLGRLFRRFLSFHVSPAMALRWAKGMMVRRGGLPWAQVGDGLMVDTLGFRLYAPP